jgi:hypothetical protein
MKRCPQCEFIYEDDQSLCDMDGILLVFDSRALPNLQQLSTSNSVLLAKTNWKSRSFPAAAALMLSTVLGLVYYVSTQTHMLRNSSPLATPGVQVVPKAAASTEPSTTTPNAPPILAKEDPGKVDDASTADKTTAIGSTVDEKTPATAPVIARPSSPAKTPKAKTTTPPKSRSSVQATPTNPKRESSIGSFLKKTGRILKKPFKR